MLYFDVYLNQAHFEIEPDSTNNLMVPPDMHCKQFFPNDTLTHRCPNTDDAQFSWHMFLKLRRVGRNIFFVHICGRLLTVLRESTHVVAEPIE